MESKDGGGEVELRIDEGDAGTLREERKKVDDDSRLN